VHFANYDVSGALGIIRCPALLIPERRHTSSNNIIIAGSVASNSSLLLPLIESFMCGFRSHQRQEQQTDPELKLNIY